MEIAKVNVGERRLNGQPFIAFKKTYGSNVGIEVNNNGFQSMTVDISPEMFEALRGLVTDHRVVEYYEQLRTQRNTSE